LALLPGQLPRLLFSMLALTQPLAQQGILAAVGDQPQQGQGPL
jgi:hypothetical protein